MRYDQKVYFVSQGESERLPNGDWTEPTETKVMRYAHVSDMGDELKQRLFDRITERGLIIRLQNDYLDKFSHIEYKGLKWRVIRHKSFRRDCAFEVGEFNGSV